MMSVSQNKFNTLDAMPETITSLFFIIKQQLKDEEHPINLVTKEFAYYFVEHYTD